MYINAVQDEADHMYSDCRGFDSCKKMLLQNIFRPQQIQKKKIFKSVKRP